MTKFIVESITGKTVEFKHLKTFSDARTIAIHSGFCKPEEIAEIYRFTGEEYKSISSKLYKKSV